MAQRKKSEIEFIQDSFCPQVAVLCSYDAEVICRKNALTFVELVQPFCRFSGEIKIIDPSNNAVTIPNMRVEIKDINYLPPQPLVCKKILDEAVMSGLLSSSAAQNVIFERPIATSNYKLSANMNTPWFEQWRDYFIKIGHPDTHEFLKHFLSCIFVVSTSHLDPLDQFQKLIQQQQQIQQASQSKPPKWFFPQSANIFKYFVLLHDVQEGEISKAHQIYESLKSTYGPANCHLLQINSKPVNNSTTTTPATTSNEPDPWLQYCKFNDAYSNSLQSMTILPKAAEADQKPSEVEESSSTEHPLALRSRSNTLDELTSSVDKLSLTDAHNNKQQQRHGMCLAVSDHDRIKTFISEFLQRGLVPYAERTIKILNEQIQSKKSILKSFGIPRKLFGGSSSSSSSTLSSASILMSGGSKTVSSSSGTPDTTSGGGAITITNNFIGTNDDLQLRRLADLAFMFRLYDLAYNSYHSAKKDFSNYLSSSSSQTNSEQVVQTKLYLAGALEMATISSFMQNFAHDLMQAAAAATTTNQSAGGGGMVNSSSSMHISSSSNSLSSLSLTSSSGKTYALQYIDEAIGLYVNDCKNLYFSIRSVLLSTEALKATGLFLKAAYQFINLANDETDVRTALFLEQAALCYLAQPQPMIRKYAFFMSLAGHRFSKAGQKRHSLRVYKHALEIYENRGWFKAQDYVNYVSSQLNHRIKDTKEALNHLERVFYKRLSNPVMISRSKQQHDHLPVCIEVSNETNLIKDFIFYWSGIQQAANSIISSSNSESKQQTIPLICLPHIDNKNIKVDLSSTAAPSKTRFIINNEHLISNDDVVSYKRHKELREMWQRFEEGLYSAIFNTPNVPIMWRPQLTLHHSHSDNKQMPKVVVGETVSILIDLKNNLRSTHIVLSDLTLLWKYVDPTTDNSEITNEVTSDNDHLTSLAECSTISEVKLLPNESTPTRVVLRVTPKKSPGHLHLLGLKYKFGIVEEDKKTMLDVKQMFEVRGARLNHNPQAMRSVVYDVDNRLNFKILPKTAQLQIELDHVPTTMICNQLERVKIYLINPSHVPIGNIKIASNGIASSNIIFEQTTSSNNSSNDDQLTSRMITYPKSDFKFSDDLVITDGSNKNEPMPSSKPPVDFIYSLGHDVVVAPSGGVHELDMWIRAPESDAEHTFYLMFAYEDVSESNQQTRAANKSTSSSSHNSLRYRVIRYEFRIKTTPSITSINNNVSIVESQKSSSLLINLEISNKQDMHSFELVDLISVSDVWRVTPVKSVEPYVLKQLHADSFAAMSSSSTFSQQVRTKINKKTEELVSVVLRAEPVQNKETTNATRSEILLFKSKFTTNELHEEKQLNERILVEFIKANVKKSLTGVSNKSCYLDLHVIWRCRETHRFGFTPIKMSTNFYINGNSETSVSMGSVVREKFNFRQSHESSSRHQTVATSQTSQEFSRMVRNLIMINHACEPTSLQLACGTSLVSLNVNIELENLCSLNQFSLIIFARNAKMNDSKFLWLGSNKKIVTLRARQTRRVQLKLGFTTNGGSGGVYEIGGQSPSLSSSSETAMVKMMNLQDAASVTSFDDIIDDLNLSSSNMMNTSTTSSNLNTTAAGTAATYTTTTDSVVSIYFKNSVSESYELLKLLSPFTVCITK